MVFGEDINRQRKFNTPLKKTYFTIISKILNSVKLYG